MCTDPKEIIRKVLEEIFEKITREVMGTKNIIKDEEEKEEKDEIEELYQELEKKLSRSGW